MDKFDELLNRKKLAIADGAMATELEARGCDINDELWSAKILAENPALIEQVHYDYFEAGADIGISASYQATVPGFIKKGFTREESEKLIMDSVKLLINARNRYMEKHPEKDLPLAAGAVGPYGAYLADGSEYRGDYVSTDRNEIEKFHRERMILLKKAGADILACETLPCLWEAEIILKIAEEIDMPCWFSFSCRDGLRISDGTSIKECAELLNNRKLVKAVGANCTHPQYISDIIKNIRDVSDKPVIVYPNKGEEYDAVNKIWLGARDGKDFRQWAGQWYNDGASIIGGCCRTSPSDIAKIEEFRKTIK